MDVPFGMTEIKRALRRMRESTPGQDEISFYMIKQLSEESLRVMFYNKVWGNGGTTTKLKRGICITKKETGEVPRKPANSLPKALPSHVRKGMERMITDRLVYFFGKKENYLLIKVDLG